MFDIPTYLIPIFLTLLNTEIKKDTIVYKPKQIVIEKNIDSVYDDCTIVKVYSNWVFFDPEPGGFKQQFETECGDIIFDERKFKVGDKVNRKKHKK